MIAGWADMRPSFGHKMRGLFRRPVGVSGLVVMPGRCLEIPGSI